MIIIGKFHFKILKFEGFTTIGIKTSMKMKICHTLSISFYTPKIVLLAREILVAKPFDYKFGSRERGQAWDKVAESLNLVQQIRFTVDQRGVRERYAKLERAYKKRLREEERAS